MPTDDRRWYKSEAMTVRSVANDNDPIIPIRAEWRCYPLGWHVGIVCSVDPVTFQFWVRWRGARSAPGMKGKGKSLEEAQILACELAEVLLWETRDELITQNVARRALKGLR